MVKSKVWSVLIESQMTNEGWAKLAGWVFRVGLSDWGVESATNVRSMRKHGVGTCSVIVRTVTQSTVTEGDDRSVLYGSDWVPRVHAFGNGGRTILHSQFKTRHDSGRYENDAEC